MTPDETDTQTATDSLPTERDDWPPDVLVVEDNQADALLIQETLPDVDATVISDGRTAIESFDRAADDALPELVILDLKLPRRSGFEVLDALQTSGTIDHTSVVVFTGSEDSADLRHADREDVAAVFTKPTGIDDYEYILQTSYDLWGAEG